MSIRHWSSNIALLRGHGRSIAVLAFNQSLKVTATVLSVAIVSLVGARLAPTHALSTAPAGVEFATVMLCSYPVSMLMRAVGRRRGFLIGAASLVAAGVLAYDAEIWNSFLLLLVAYTFFGVFVAFANYYRFAVVDELPDELHAGAMSMVVAAGIVGALCGPLLADMLGHIAGFPPYSLCFAAFGVLGLISFCSLFLGNYSQRAPEAPQTVPALARVKWTPPIVVAMFANGAAFFMMLLLMMQAPLAIAAHGGTFRESTSVIRAHMLAMFLPSLIIAGITAKIGLRRMLLAGFGLLTGAAAFGVLSANYEYVFVALILLGAGWNLTYVGGSALLVRGATKANTHKLQGINEVIVATCATAGSALAGVAETYIGWTATNTVALVMSSGGLALCAWYLSRSENSVTSLESLPADSES